MICTPANSTCRYERDEYGLVFAIECSWSLGFFPQTVSIVIPAEKYLLIFPALALKPLNLLAVAVDLVLVTIDLLLLLVVGILLALQLVTDQRTGA